MDVQRLKNARKQKYSSAEAFAAEIGVNRVTVAKWETGRAKPSMDTLQRIAKILDVTVAFLMGEDEHEYSRRTLPSPFGTRGHTSPIEDSSGGIAARLKALRLSSRKDTMEFADAVGVHPTTVTYWEKGMVEPSTEELCRLSSLMSVPVAYLLDLSDAAEPVSFDFETTPYSALRDRVHREAPMMSPAQRAEVAGILRNALAELEADSRSPQEILEAEELARLDDEQLKHKIDTLRDNIEKYTAEARSSGDPQTVVPYINKDKAMLKSAVAELDVRLKKSVQKP